MLKIIAFVGPTGSGKSAIQKGVIQYYKERASLFSNQINPYLRIKPVITTTDRRTRVGEINGVDYNFIETEKFKQKQNNRQFVETKESLDFEGKLNHYGLTKAALGPLENDDILILSIDIGGLLKLRSFLEEEEVDSDNIIFPIYIKASAEIRMKRCMRRESPVSNTRYEYCDCPDELVYKICERMLRDEKETEDSIDFCTLTLKNEVESDREQCINFVNKLIQGML